MKRPKKNQGSISSWPGRALLSGAVTLLASNCALPDFHRVPDEAGGASAVGGHTAAGGRSLGDTKGVNTGGNGGGGALSSGGTPSSGGAVATAGGVYSGGSGLATGGTLSTLGATSSGGAATSGGTSSNSATTGAIVAIGGAATGGAPETGGLPAMGGAPATGGAATGGFITTGGASMSLVTTAGGATGGAATTGGIASTGGTTETGGIPATGGASTTSFANGGAAMGGAPETGGIASTGGVPATGGAATGGVVTTGGTPSTGGAPTTGGLPATGGTPATGGIPSTGIEFVPPAASTKSCSGLGSICQGESCCTSIEMPGGTYPMGRATEDCSLMGCQTGTGNEGCPADSTCSPWEQPEHSATVSSFALDKYEVTVGRFRNFVNSYTTWRGANPSNPLHGDGVNPNAPSTGWGQSWTAAAADLPTDATALIASLKCTNSTWTDSAGTSTAEAYPINCVTWYQAFAFCIWDGGRLPTEAEWEYAAAGGAQNRLYPWGRTAPDATRANLGSTDHSPKIVVGSKQSAYFGHADLAGSMWEWAFDGYNQTYYGTTGNPASCDNCANANIVVSYRVLRGGGWDSGAGDLRAAYRGYSTAADRRSNFGFRCARSP